MTILKHDGWRLALAFLLVTALVGLVFYVTPPVFSGQRSLKTRPYVLVLQAKGSRLLRPEPAVV